MLARVLALFALICLSVVPAQAQTSSLVLAWDPSADVSVTGYMINYGPTSGALNTTVDAGPNTTITINGLTPGQRYYFTAQSYTADRTLSVPTPEISGDAAPLPAPVVVLGLGPQTGDGGHLAMRGDAASDFGWSKWNRLPWAAYLPTGGGLRVATGNVDADAAKEVVLGLGRGGQGYVAVLDDADNQFRLLTWLRVNWAAYNTSNGETYPAVGDIDGDGRGEIVVGLGQGGQGYMAVFDDASGGFAHMRWLQVPWDAYKTGFGSTHPAVGDLDGDGRAEIVVGMGQGSQGWLQIVGSIADNYAHRMWRQVEWSTYNAANGTTYPAVGDLDGDGRAEIVVGLGQGSQGWFEIFDDATTQLAHQRWDRTNWIAYTVANGELHPAIGNVDADPALEIVFGLGQYAGNGGWFQVRDDASTDYAHVRWQNVGWAAFAQSGGALFPAILK